MRPCGLSRFILRFFWLFWRPIRPWISRTGPFFSRFWANSLPRFPSITIGAIAYFFTCIIMIFAFWTYPVTGPYFCITSMFIIIFLIAITINISPFILFGFWKLSDFFQTFSLFFLERVIDFLSIAVLNVFIWFFFDFIWIFQNTAVLIGYPPLPVLIKCFSFLTFLYSTISRLYWIVNRPYC